MEQSTEGRWERPDAPLGTLVYRAGLLSKEKLESALVEGRRTGKRLGEVLLQKGWIDEKDLARLVAGQKGIAFVSLRGRGYDKEAARLLPERLCRGNDAIAIEDAGSQIVVAVADPTNDEAVAEVGEALGRQIELVVATASEIHDVLDEVFRPDIEVPLVGEFGLRLATAEPVEAVEPVEEPVADLPVAEEPVVETPVVEEPVVVEPVVVEPVAEAPVVEEPVVVEPVAEEPVVVEPVAEAPVVEEPVVVEPVVVEPVVVEPVIIEIAREIAPEPEPEPDAFRAVAIELPKLHPPTPPEPTEPHVEIVGVHPEAVIEIAPEPLPQNDALLGIAAPSEPTIERNEEAHVSLAFHAPPVAPEPEPPPAPKPAFEPAPEPVTVAENEIVLPPPTEEELGWRIVLNLRDDEEIDVAFFSTEAEANAAARELVVGIAQDGDWPQVGRKFIPPERITSVEVRERSQFGGSRDRAEWGNG
jgi:hypothetical protein